MKLTVAPLVLALLLLSGCAVQPVAYPTPTPSATATSRETPSATPTPDPGVLTVSGSGWDIHGPDGDASGLWTGPNGRPTVDDADWPGKLTALIGSDPVVTTEPSSSHFPETTIYSWPGLVLRVPNEQKADSQFATSLTLTARSSGNAEFRTGLGIAVGDSQDQTVSAAFASYQDPDGRTVYLVEPDHEYVAADKDTDAWNCVRVTIGADGTVAIIGVPGGAGNVL